MEIKKIFLVTIFIISSIGLFAQTDSIVKFGEEKQSLGYQFAFNMVPSALGGLSHYALIHYLPDSTREVTQLSKDDFMNQLAGKLYSEANPEKKNMWELAGITDFSVLDNLWRLRYRDYPYFNMSGQPISPGWSANQKEDYMPSEGQMELLRKEFGMKQVSDYIIGTNVLKLLKTLQDSTWINNYKILE